MVDDVNGPQVIWHAPRPARAALRPAVAAAARPGPTTRRCGRSFVEVMGGRVGRRRPATRARRRRPRGRHAPRRCWRDMVRDANRGRAASTSRRFTPTSSARHAAVQPVPEHHRARVRRHAARSCASRPGAHARRRRTWTCSRSPRAAPTTRHAARQADRRRAPARRRAAFGLVLNQDVGNFARTPARAAPARPHAPHGVAHRGVPRSSTCTATSRSTSGSARRTAELGLAVSRSTTCSRARRSATSSRRSRAAPTGSTRELMASCYHPDGTDDHNVFRGTGTEFARVGRRHAAALRRHHALHRAAPHPPRRRRRAGRHLLRRAPRVEARRRRAADRHGARAPLRRPVRAPSGRSGDRGPGVRVRLDRTPFPSIPRGFAVRDGLDARRPRPDRHHVLRLHSRSRRRRTEPWP